MTSTTNQLRHPSRIGFLLFVCMVSALGGFLWGFDAIVISGTIGPVKAQFGLAAFMEGLFVSSGLIGAVIGAAAAGPLSNRHGRKPNLCLAALLMLASAVGSAWATGITTLIMARWLGGLGVGIAAMVCPVYIAEISPSHLRGRMVTLFQFAITIGILAALVSNAWIARLAKESDVTGAGVFIQWFLVDQTWRSMFAAEMIPGILFVILSMTIPESPRWLVQAGRNKQALSVLGKVLKRGSDEELLDIQKAVSREASETSSFSEVFNPRYRKPLVIALLLSIFSQFSGINSIFYYGPTILEEAGFGATGALGGMATIGFFNMIFTVIAIAVVDRAGRRPLLLIGTAGAILCLCGMGLFLNSGKTGPLIVLICGFVAFFAFSIGPIKFIFASEIFPTNVRAHGVSVAVLVMWAADTLVGQLFPMLRDSIGAPATFFTFAALLAPQLWMVWRFMPETAGRSLEEIESWWKPNGRASLQAPVESSVDP